MSEIFEYGAVPLACVGKTASWRRAKNDGPRYAPMLVITECAASDDSVYTPASSVTVSGVEQLRSLKTAIDEALKGCDQ